MLQNVHLPTTSSTSAAQLSSWLSAQQGERATSLTRAIKACLLRHDSRLPLRHPAISRSPDPTLLATISQRPIYRPSSGHRASRLCLAPAAVTFRLSSSFSRFSLSSYSHSHSTHPPRRHHIGHPSRAFPRNVLRRGLASLQRPTIKHWHLCTRHRRCWELSSHQQLPILLEGALSQLQRRKSRSRRPSLPLSRFAIARRFALEAVRSS